MSIFSRRGADKGGQQPHGVPPRFEPTPAEMQVINAEIQPEGRTNFADLGRILSERGIAPERLDGVRGAIVEGRRKGIVGGGPERH